MDRIFDLTIKDLKQLLRDWRTAVFLLVMPLAFTILFGFAFGGSNANGEDPRLPVGIVNEDNSEVASQLITLIEGSEVIRLVTDFESIDELDESVREEESAAGLIIPTSFGNMLLTGETIPLEVIVDGSSNSGLTAEREIQAAVTRLSNAALVAQFSTQIAEEQGAINQETDRQKYHDLALEKAIIAWEEPPVGTIYSIAGIAEEETGNSGNAFAHSSPGMMAQFAIAGLMGAAAILVTERKTGSLRRLLTANISLFEIFIGHYLAMFIIIFVQLTILVLFGQLFLQLPYLSQPLATFLLIGATALFAAALGLLIGAVATKEEQVIVLALVPMFILSGLGGAWVPLEFTPESFQRIAFLTPLAWVIEGFKDIIIRGQGVESILLSIAVLLGYTIILFALAVWRFRTE